MALPQRFFGEVDSTNRVPRNNVLLIGAICLVGAMMLSFSLGADLLNSKLRSHAGTDGCK